MTEEEAKTKRCHRKFGFAAEDSLCEGSVCMAWRPTVTAHSRNLETNIISNQPVGFIDASKEEFVNVVSGGYCGLAGKP